MKLNKFSPKTFFNLSSFPFPDLFDEGKPVWDSLKLLESFLNQLKPKSFGDFEGVYFVNKETISIGDRCRIAPTVLIEGPCYIGNDVEVRHGAYIRSGCFIGDGCLIGHASEVSRSILLPRAKIPHFNYVGDSILGFEVNMGAGSKCANFRLDGGDICLFDEGEKISTGLTKLGSIVGSFSSIGCNAVLNPGTFILPGKKVLPGSTVGGVIA